MSASAFSLDTLEILSFVKALILFSTAPHEQIHPLIREDPALATSNFAKANAEYFELLKRKYCV